MDFSASLIAAAKEKFPHATIGHDYFHSSNLLNRGIMKELSKLKRTRFLNIISQFKQAMRVSLASEKENHLNTFKTEIPFLKKAWTMYKELFPLFLTDSFKNFTSFWKRLRNARIPHRCDFGSDLLKTIEKMLPGCGFTEKNFKTFSKKLCQKWRSFVRKERKKIEKKKKKFSAAKSVILMNPSNMDRDDSKALRRLLAKFPYLRPYRKAVRKFHYQYKAPESGYRSLGFLRKIIHEDSHDQLKSAVSTLIERQDNIFAYRRILKAHPELREGKSIRSNHEQLNCKVNKVARNQCGFRSKGNIISRLGGILDCPIIISDHVLSS